RRFDREMLGRNVGQDAGGWKAQRPGLSPRPNRLQFEIASQNNSTRKPLKRALERFVSDAGSLKNNVKNDSAGPCAQQTLTKQGIDFARPTGLRRLTHQRERAIFMALWREAGEGLEVGAI